MSNRHQEPRSQRGMHRRWLSSLLLLLAAWTAHAEMVPVPSQGETVVLLHGLGMRSWAMGRLEANLSQAGYRVLNLSYPSRKLAIEKLGGEWLPSQLRQQGVTTTDRVHFVTHSMGGIVVRMWLRECGVPANLGRVVMVAPPNAGSAVADRLKNFGPFRWFMGSNALRLGTGANSVPRSLGPWPPQAGQLGVIAGDRSVNPLFSHWLHEPNDGAVTVANARLAGMSDFIVLHHSHTFLLWRGETLAVVRGFLRDGRFDRNENPELPSASSAR